MQRRLRAGEDVADRPLANRQAEHLAEHQAQPFDADRLGVVQINRNGFDGLAERRAGRETFRRGGDGAFAATSAVPAEQAHTCDVRLDGRQFNAVVDLLRRLPGRPRGFAMGAGIKPEVDDAVGVGIERAAKAGAALARWCLAGGLFIGFLPLARRQRGIARRLGRLLQPGQPHLQFGDPRLRRFQLADKRQQSQDQRVLLGNHQLGKLNLGRHPNVESSRP